MDEPQQIGIEIQRLAMDRTARPRWDERCDGTPESSYGCLVGSSTKMAVFIFDDSRTASA